MLDQSVKIFIDTRYTTELRDEIYRSFNIFELFEYNDASDNFIAIVMQCGNLSNEMISDQILEELHRCLNYVLNEHEVKLTSDTNIAQKNEICLGFYRLQYLEDYNNIIQTLEGFQDDTTQLSLVLSAVCDFDDIVIFPLISEFNPEILLSLKEFIYEKERTAEESIPVNAPMMRQLKTLFGIASELTIGQTLLDAGVLLGSRFVTYLQYLNVEDLGTAHKHIAENLLSVIYLSDDGYKNPLLTYRSNSAKILSDLDKITGVEACISSLIDKVNTVLKVNDDKIRVS